MSDSADYSGWGVVLERYAYFEQDEDSVWLGPGGAKIAWFQDPMVIC